MRRSPRRAWPRSTGSRSRGRSSCPLIAKYAAESGRYRAVVCLGAVIRGETDHYDYVCARVGSGHPGGPARDRRAVRLRGPDRRHDGPGARSRHGRVQARHGSTCGRGGARLARGQGRARARARPRANHGVLAASEPRFLSRERAAGFSVPLGAAARPGRKSGSGPRSGTLRPISVMSARDAPAVRRSLRRSGWSGRARAARVAAAPSPSRSDWGSAGAGRATVTASFGSPASRSERPRSYSA